MSRKLYNTPEERKAARTAAQRRYMTGSKGKATRKAYEQSAGGRQARQCVNRNYNDKRRAAITHRQAQEQQQIQEQQAQKLEPYIWTLPEE